MTGGKIPFRQFDWRISVIRIGLKNRHYIGGIWIDARFNNGTIPFCQSPAIKGFPRKLEYLESHEIFLEDDCQVVYRKEGDVIATGIEITYSPRVFRIAYKPSVEREVLDCEV
ncbi:MAG: hypothetical protein JST01_22085 [Cyanobacteria bacterium SZAS TMP-1]|nr:hypothetical protein [Cyanobacteria bacterium SZAS TMP-1]